MDMIQDVKWYEIYIQLERKIVDLTPEEVNQVMSYVLALKAKRVQKTCEVSP